MAAKLDKNSRLKLIKAALKCRQNAYAPYSKHKVGAAVLTDNGNIYGGCNIENASYSLTIDAEQAAVSHAVTRGEQKIKAVCIASSSAKSCGACRQVISEFADKNCPVLLVSVGKKDKIKVTEYKLEQLLPNAFGKKDLKTKKR
jgi:cytidine deaminase